MEIQQKHIIFGEKRGQNVQREKTIAYSHCASPQSQQLLLTKRREFQKRLFQTNSTGKLYHMNTNSKISEFGEKQKTSEFNSSPRKVMKTQTYEVIKLKPSEMTNNTFDRFLIKKDSQLNEKRNKIKEDLALINKDSENIFTAFDNDLFSSSHKQKQIYIAKSTQNLINEEDDLGFANNCNKCFTTQDELSQIENNPLNNLLSIDTSFPQAEQYKDIQKYLFPKKQEIITNTVRIFKNGKEFKNNRMDSILEDNMIRIGIPKSYSITRSILKDQESNKSKLSSSIDLNSIQPLSVTIGGSSQNGKGKRANILEISKDPLMNQALSILMYKMSDQRNVDDISTLMKATKLIPFFKKMEQKISLYQSIVKAMQFQFIPKGGIAFYHGDIPDRFYITLKGKVSIFIPKRQQDIVAEEMTFFQQLSKEKQRLTIHQRLLQRSIKKAYQRLINLLYFVKIAQIRNAVSKNMISQNCFSFESGKTLIQPLSDYSTISPQLKRFLCSPINKKQAFINIQFLNHEFDEQVTQLLQKIRLEKKDENDNFVKQMLSMQIYQYLKYFAKFK